MFVTPLSFKDTLSGFYFKASLGLYKPFKIVFPLSPEVLTYLF